MASQRKRLRFVIGGLLILGALVYLVYGGMQGTMVYYFTVSELKAKTADASLYEKGIRVSGKVMDNSIERNDKSREHTFKIVEGATALPVQYSGTLPDMFKEGADVIVEGKYTLEGTFMATTLLTSCPSKYEPSDENGGSMSASGRPASDT